MINIHPLAKKITILLILKVVILWIFFKIVPVEKIRLNTSIVENHFLNTHNKNTSKESAAHD